MTACAPRPSISSVAHEMSAAYPSVRISRSGRPMASIARCSLVPSPPRERPIACGPLFSMPPPNAGALSRWSNRSGCVRSRPRRPPQVQLAARHHRAATARNACTRCASGQTPRKIASGAACSVDPEYGFDKPAIVGLQRTQPIYAAACWLRYLAATSPVVRYSSFECRRCRL